MLTSLSDSQEITIIPVQQWEAKTKESGRGLYWVTELEQTELQSLVFWTVNHTSLARLHLKSRMEVPGAFPLIPLSNSSAQGRLQLSSHLSAQNSFPWEVRAMERRYLPALTAAGSRKPAWLCNHFWELGITLRHHVLVLVWVFIVHKFIAAFYLAFSCESLFQCLQPNND